MGSIGVFIEMTIIFSLVCAASLICIIQANSLRPTYYLYVFEASQTFRYEAPELAGVGSQSYVEEAEFEDSDWDMDMDVFDHNDQEEDENREGDLSILCWLALGTNYAGETSKQRVLMWRAPCYQGMEQLDSSPLGECNLWVSRMGELTASLASGEVAYTSQRTISGVEQMVLSEENDLLLLSEDRKAVWSSRHNKVFNCVD